MRKYILYPRKQEHALFNLVISVSELSIRLSEILSELLYFSNAPLTSSFNCPIIVPFASDLLIRGFHFYSVLFLLICLSSKTLLTPCLQFWVSLFAFTLYWTMTCYSGPYDVVTMFNRVHCGAVRDLRICIWSSWIFFVVVQYNSLRLLLTFLLAIPIEVTTYLFSWPSSSLPCVSVLACCSFS